MRHRLWLSSIGCTTAMLLACGSPQTPLGPTSSPVSAPVVPPPGSPPATTSHPLQGQVLDTAFRPIADARIEVMSGPNAGRSTMSRSDGQFAFIEGFDDSTAVRAIKDGFITSTATLRPLCSACRYYYHTFYLAIPAPSVNIAGDYTLTLLADASCSALPAALRSRVYDVRIAPASWPDAPDRTIFTAQVTSVPLVEGYDRFPIGVVENFLTFELRGHGPYLLERLDDQRFLGFDGLAAAIADAEPLPTVTTNFDGWIGVCELARTGNYYDCGKSRPECVSRNHQLILKKR